MANRLIGIDLDSGSLRIAVLRRDKGGVGVIALEEYAGEDPAELLAAARAAAGGAFTFGDRLAAALPAGQGYVRSLTFPFSDRRKIKAAAPLELSAQIPVSSEGCTTALLWPQERKEADTVLAAAVPTAAIAERLALFDAAETPLQVLDLMPYALAAGLGGRVRDALLICAGSDETTVSRLAEGELAEYRLIPGRLEPGTPRVLNHLRRECQVLLGRQQGENLPVYLAGPAATAELIDSLQTAGLQAALLSLTFGGRMIPPAFVPAVALALRADPRDGGRSFNLRQGEFAFRGELRAAGWPLAIAAGLLLLTILSAGTAAYLNYRDRARQAEQLQQELVRIYQGAFPGSQLTVDVALQMESKLRELHNSAQALGITGQPPPWRILRELSDLPAQVNIELDEFYCDDDEVRLGGATDSFETINRIRDLLDGSPLFASVEVAESRKSLDGRRVNFRFRLPLAIKGGKS